MTDRGERTKCQFKRIEGYLIIDSQYYPSLSDDHGNDKIFIKENDIFWLYKNLNELLDPDNIERKFRESSKTLEEYLDIEFKGGLDRCTTVMIDITSKNDNSSAIYTTGLNTLLDLDNVNINTSKKNSLP